MRDDATLGWAVAFSQAAYTDSLLSIKQPPHVPQDVTTVLLSHDTNRFVDEGGHPDDFVRVMFRTAVADNQVCLTVGCSILHHLGLARVHLHQPVLKGCLSAC